MASARASLASTASVQKWLAGIVPRPFLIRVPRSTRCAWFPAAARREREVERRNPASAPGLRRLVRAVMERKRRPCPVPLSRAGSVTRAAVANRFAASDNAPRTSLPPSICSTSANARVILSMPRVVMLIVAIVVWSFVFEPHRDYCAAVMSVIVSPHFPRCTLPYYSPSSLYRHDGSDPQCGRLCPKLLVSLNTP